MRRIHEAKHNGAGSVQIWGTGNAKRSFLHADDAAEACLLLMRNEHMRDLVNIPGESEVTIRSLACMIKEAVGYAGDLEFDASKPDGSPQKLLDGGKLDALGWKPRIGLEEGIRDTYRWFLNAYGGQ
jgi:GDP-L-fucose synthase